MSKDAGTPTPAIVSNAAEEHAPIAQNAITVIGLITGPDGARALLRDGRGKFRSVKSGGRIGGYYVAAINPGELVLSKGIETQRLQVADTIAGGALSGGTGLKQGR